MNVTLIRAYLVDDEPLAITRLRRLLEATGRVTIVGTTTDPEEALAFLEGGADVDAVFLDISMPGMTGLELAARLPVQPLVVFTTAHDDRALEAFEVNAIDYLTKPLRAADLTRALAKIERLLGAGAGTSTNAQASAAAPPLRIASRLGERIRLIDLAQISHFVAEDKLTLAICADGSHAVDPSITELEKRLADAGFFRIHRATLVNLSWVKELHAGIGGGLHVRLSDAKHTDLPVSRDRTKALKDRLGV